MTTMKSIVASALALTLLAHNGWAKDWWNPEWQYRFSVTVDAQDHEFADKLIELDVLIPGKLAEAQASERDIDITSIRVIETDDAGKVIRQCRSQYDFSTLLWIAEGATKAHTQRHFDIYFNAADRPRPVESGPPLIKQRSSAGRLQIETPAGYYAFNAKGGAFNVFGPSMCRDNEVGKDWIRDDLSPDAGILNAADRQNRPIFHLDKDKGSCQSEPTVVGPLHVRLRSIKRSGEGAYRIYYDIFPQFVRATVPGDSCTIGITPGGDKLEANDYVARADGATKTRGQTWDDDAKAQWLIVGGARDSRKLFLAHAGADDVKPSLRWDASQQTVTLGWDRKSNPVVKKFPSTYYVGFAKAADHEEMQRLMQSLLQTPKIGVGATEKNPEEQPSAAAEPGKKQSWFTVMPHSYTVRNELIEVGYGPDQMVDGNAATSLGRFIYRPAKRNLAAALDCQGFGYAVYGVLGPIDWKVTHQGADYVETTTAVGSGSSKVVKRERLFRGLPVWEIQYDRLDSIWWEDFFADFQNHVYAIYGVPKDVTNADAAKYGKLARQDERRFFDAVLKFLGATPAQVTYRDHLILGQYDPKTGLGLGMVTPTSAGLSRLKLWSPRNYEWFAFYGEKKQLPLKRWFFVTTDGRDGIFRLGKRLAELHADGKSLTDHADELRSLLRSPDHS